MVHLKANPAVTIPPLRLSRIGIKKVDVLDFLTSAASLMIGWYAVAHGLMMFNLRCNNRKHSHAIYLGLFAYGHLSEVVNIPNRTEQLPCHVG